jgi:stage II sporulation protein AA (anti-sigma F factor antagonist)
VRRRRRNGISTSLRAGSGLVELHGELDISAIAEIESAMLGLIEKRPDRIVVDFSAATFVDSKATEALMRAAQAADLAGVPVAAAGVTGAVRRAVDVYGLDRALPLYESRAQALAATGAPNGGGD